jgi:hypothetical protein
MHESSAPMSLRSIRRARVSTGSRRCPALSPIGASHVKSLDFVGSLKAVLPTMQDWSARRARDARAGPASAEPAEIRWGTPRIVGNRLSSPSIQPCRLFHHQDSRQGGLTRGGKPAGTARVVLGATASYTVWTLVALAKTVFPSCVGRRSSGWAAATVTGTLRSRSGNGCSSLA